MKHMTSVVKYSFIMVLVLVMIAPVLTAVLGSLRTTGEFLAAPFGLPLNGIQWQNYTDIVTGRSFWIAFKNSLYITVAATVFVVVISSLLAFIFARIEFAGKSVLFNIITIGLLFPIIVAILPVFIQIRNLGLINSYWGVILPLVTFAIPGSVVILRGFFRAVPLELEDAAYIDGCSILGFFWHILLPLARPAIMAVATLTIITAWNEYFLSLLVLNDADKWPLTLGIMQFQGQFGTDWAKVMAYVTLLIVPAVLFYMVSEKYIVTGLTGGELKG